MNKKLLTFAALITTSLIASSVTQSNTTSVTHEEPVDLSVLNEPDTCSWDPTVQQFLK